MFQFIRDMYLTGVIGEDYLDIAVEIGMITEDEKKLILGAAKK